MGGLGNLHIQKVSVEEKVSSEQENLHTNLTTVQTPNHMNEILGLHP
jgi:hypothetical protein